MSQTIQFHLSLSYDEFSAVYKGHAQHVITHSIDGRRVRFPADILKPYLTHSGIQGTFTIHFNENNKFKFLEKVD